MPSLWMVDGPAPSGTYTLTAISSSGLTENIPGR
jgi:hypothetical protein